MAWIRPQDGFREIQPQNEFREIVPHTSPTSSDGYYFSTNLCRMILGYSTWTKIEMFSIQVSNIVESLLVKLVKR
jgi:hypothetical protein